MFIFFLTKYICFLFFQEDIKTQQLFSQTFYLQKNYSEIPT